MAQMSKTYNTQRGGSDEEESREHHDQKERGEHASYMLNMACDVLDCSNKVVQT